MTHFKVNCLMAIQKEKVTYHNVSHPLPHIQYDKFNQFIEWRLSMYPYNPYNPYIPQYEQYIEPMQQYDPYDPNRQFPIPISFPGSSSRELERRVNEIEKRVNQLQQVVERQSRRLNRLNQRLRVVENKLTLPFTPYEDGF